jgi:DUF177 domain-containing protein
MLLAHGNDDGCARGDGTLDGRMRVVDDEEQSHGAPAERLRAEVLVRRRLVRDPEGRVADGELGDDVLMLVGAAHPMELDCSEGGLVELDGLATAAHRELWGEGAVHAAPDVTLDGMRSFSLRTVKLRPGEEYRDAIELELEPFELGRQRYLPVPETVPAEFVISKASTGTVLELRFTARLHGPCFRCLDDAVLELSIDAREYQATSPGEADELMSQYVEDDRLDLVAWAHDAVALALPDKILCRPDCAGLCAVCGKNLNDEPHAHEDAPTDSRWAALESLREQL